MFDNNPFSTQQQIPQNPWGMQQQQNPFMAGTIDPAKQEQDQKQQAIIDALRGIGGQQQQAPEQVGKVVSTGSAASGLDPTAIGGALKGIGGMFGTPAVTDGGFSIGQGSAYGGNRKGL